ncbi:MAG TPA: MgtC/SapB family protein [Rhodocyclaceae bacterium]|nr:MgtC/SapB family protein [Rhodocyclaceae bacterium]
MQIGHWDFPSELFIRLGFALLVGLVLGLNRWLHHKSAGIRTHSLVSLGSAVAMLSIASSHGSDAQAASRVMQGLITGIGFLGAGVIVRGGHSQTVHGLTTAASIWACALLGAAFGVGQYAIGISSLAVIFLVLLFGGGIERVTGAVMGIDRESEVPEDQANS